MKKTIKFYSSKVLAVTLALTMMVTALSICVSAGVLDSVVTTDKLGNIDYAQYAGSNANSYVMEFNPSSGLMPMGYVKSAGWSATLEKQTEAAEDDGYDVYGMINGEFFSPASGNHGTLTGRLIGNGRILSDGNQREYSFAIDNEGKFDFAWTQLAYHFYVEGKEVGNSVIERINKRYNGDWKFDALCYFDSACGTKTDTVSGHKGVEVVFNKLNGSELIAEGILEGEVVSVHTDTYGTAFSENQFVLYAHNASAYNSTLANLKPGQKVQIYAEELNNESKEIVKKANTLMSATYPVVNNGQNTTMQCPMTDVGEFKGSALTTTRAQRTAIGVKADGTYVYFVSSGRNYNSGDGAGLTIYEVGEAMIALGCVKAVNLDGGGSSTMRFAGTNKYETENRPVGSVMMIVSRNDATTSPDAKADLNNWIYNANSECNNGNYTGTQKALIQEAAAAGQAVYDNANSMTADYIRAVMEIRKAMGLVKDIRPKPYLTLKADAWSESNSNLTLTNDSYGALVLDSVKEWPWAFYSCDVNVSADAKIFYDITGTANVSIILIANGEEYKLNEYIAPNNLDENKDIVANGASFKGSINISKLCATGLDISSIQFCTSAGGASQLIVREFDIRDAYCTGDTDGDIEVNSSDARALLRHFAGNGTLTGKAYEAADANGDGTVNTADIRHILYMSVGLA